MNILLRVLFFGCLLTPSYASQADNFDYFSANRGMIRNGVQAVLTCNGLFTSQRSLEQVFAQELAYIKEPVGTVDGGNYRIDVSNKFVSVGGDDDGHQVSAVFRKGIGCVVLGPQQTLEHVEKLPSINIPESNVDRSKIPWPQGDLLVASEPASGVDQEALKAASEWAFVRDSQEQDTLSLIVLHKGQICLLYTSPSPRDQRGSRMPSSA